MSKQSQQRRGSDDISYIPKSSSKTVIIQRGSRTPGMRTSMYSSTGRSSMGGSINPSVYAKLSNSGIVDFKQHRETEKRDMQNLNERLATYIEKVRFLEAQIKEQAAELEMLRNRKDADWKPIKAMYEGELDQCRKVIEELSKDKGIDQSRLAALQDEIKSLKDLIGTYESQARDYAKKIDQLNQQVGEYEGELAALRMRVGSLEDENAKQRDIINKQRAEIQDLRADLQTETEAHIEQEVRCGTLQEENEFLKELIERLELARPEPVTIGGLDVKSFYTGEMKRAVRDVQSMYDEQCEILRQEMENKMQAQLDTIKSGSYRDTIEIEHVRTENQRLKDQLQEARGRISKLESELANLRNLYEQSCRELEEKQSEYDQYRADMERRVIDLQNQVESLLVQLNELIDAKMSLELEISCYKKLLEGEENRTGLRQLVEAQLGTRGTGAGSLAQIIDNQSNLSSTTARTMVQRSSKGAVAFSECDQSGAFVCIENQTSGGRAKVQSLKGWKLQKSLPNGRVTQTIDLPDMELRPGQQFKVWAKGANPEAKGPNEMVCDAFSFGSGNGQWSCKDADGAEKATLTIKQVAA